MRFMVHRDLPRKMKARCSLHFTARSAMGFFKLGRLERGKESKADKKEGEPLLEGGHDERKKREHEGGMAKPAAEGRSGAATRVQAGLSVNDFISKTKTQQRQGLKPSGPELIAYARYLGIDPVADHDLLWIAVEVRCRGGTA
eukprot:g4278.t1